jgi:hypothetical protein
VQAAFFLTADWNSGSEEFYKDAFDWGRSRTSGQRILNCPWFISLRPDRHDNRHQKGLDRFPLQQDRLAVAPKEALAGVKPKADRNRITLSLGGS